MDRGLRDLPIEERLRLVEDLWDSIAADQSHLPLTEAQRALLDERLAKYRESQEPGRPAHQVIDDIRKRL